MFEPVHGRATEPRYSAKEVYKGLKQTIKSVNMMFHILFLTLLELMGQSEESILQ